MNWLIDKVLPGILSGLVVTAIVAVMHLIRTNTFNRKASFRLGALFTVPAIALFAYCPPYSVSEIDWCLATQGTTSVRGEVVHWVWRTAVRDVTIQVKIFPISSDLALQKEKFGISDWNGRFSVELDQPQPKDGMYLVNTQQFPV